MDPYGPFSPMTGEKKQVFLGEIGLGNISGEKLKRNKM
jgi:hypothetical protein